MGTKISALPSGTTPTGVEPLPAVQGGITVGLTTRQVGGALLVAAVSLAGNATGSSANVGNIGLGATLAFSGSTLQTTAGTGDVTWSANSFVTAIGATKVTSAMLNADVFSTPHSWAGQQTFTAPILGTPASGVATNLTGTAAGLTAGNVTTNANLTGPITSSGNATSIAAQTGTGTTFVVQTNPSLITPALGVATATSLAIAGATIGSNGLAVTGASALSGQVTNALGTIITSQPLTSTQTWNAGGVVFTGVLINVTNTASADLSRIFDFQIAGNSVFHYDVANAALAGPVFQIGQSTNSPAQSYAQFQMNGAATLSLIAYRNNGNNIGEVDFSSSGATLSGPAGQPTSIQSANTQARISIVSGATGYVQFTTNNVTAYHFVPAAATHQFGQADANGAAVAQTLRAQSAITGTDVAAANFTIQGSRQTGAGATGQIILQTSPKLASGTTQGSYVTALTLTAPAVNMQPSVVIGNQALATTATDGFLYITTGAGAPTGVPTAFTGRAPLYYDTTNHQLWVYDGSWLQPKTAAAAAVVTWQ